MSDGLPSSRSITRLLGSLAHHAVGLARAYAAATVSVAVALSLASILYGPGASPDCYVDCGVTSVIGLAAAIVTLPIYAAATFLMGAFGAAAVLAMPPFVIVPAYVMAITAADIVRRPKLVALCGAVAGPLVGLPLMVAWSFLASDPAYRGSIGHDLASISVEALALASVAGTAVGFVVAVRQDRLSDDAS